MPLLVILACVFALALMLWSARVLRRFRSDYRYPGEFAGRRYECILRIASAEAGTPCAVGADASALYLLAPSSHRRRWWSYGGGQLIQETLRIPWTDLEYQEKRVLCKECVWFAIPAKKFYFYVSKDVGDKLLVDAGRKIQPAVELR